MWAQVGHVEAHRTEKERQQMSLFEKFITEGNEKADEQAKKGARLDGGFMAQQEQARSSRKEKRCTQLCSVPSSGHSGTL